MIRIEIKATDPHEVKRLLADISAKFGILPTNDRYTFHEYDAGRHSIAKVSVNPLPLIGDGLGYL